MRYLLSFSKLVQSRSCPVRFLILCGYGSARIFQRGLVHANISARFILACKCRLTTVKIHHYRDLSIASQIT